MGQSLRRCCQEAVRRCFGLKHDSQEISILNKKQTILPQDEERKIMACTIIDADDNLEQEDDSQFSAEWTIEQKENNGINDSNFNNLNQIEDIHADSQMVQSKQSELKQKKLVKIGVFDEEIGKTKQQEILDQDPDYFTTMESINAQPDGGAQIFYASNLNKKRDNNDEEEQGGRFEKLEEEHDFNANSQWVDDIQIEL